jgi:hypothetical protein
MRILGQIAGWVLVAVGAFFVLAALDALLRTQTNWLPSLFVGGVVLFLGAALIRAGR